MAVKVKRGRKKATWSLENKLTLLEMKFVYEYAKDGNAREASLRAGYSLSSSSTAHCLLRKPHIRRAIEEERREIRRRAGLSIDTVVSGLWEQADYYGLDASHAARVRAWEALGEVVGIIPDKKLTRADTAQSNRDQLFSVTDLPADLQRQILEHLRSKLQSQEVLTIEHRKPENEESTDPRRDEAGG